MVGSGNKERMGELIQQGYKLLHSRRETEACDRWLEAWELAKQLAKPEWRTTEEFDRAYRGPWEYVFNWCQDLEAELGNAGVEDPTYHEHRLRYAREFLGRFPSEDANHYVNFMRAQGEALWKLGRQAEAEEVYQSLVDRFPDEAWGHIGWTDRYWLFHDPSKEYGKAEEIMKRARPGEARPQRPWRPAGTAGGSVCGMGEARGAGKGGHATSADCRQAGADRAADVPGEGAGVANGFARSTRSAICRRTRTRGGDDPGESGRRHGMLWLLESGAHTHTSAATTLGTSGRT